MDDNFDYKDGFYRILDAIPVHVYWKDTEGRYLGCNNLMAKAVGLSRKEIIGKTDDDMVWKDGAKKTHQIEQIVMSNKAKYEAEEPTNFGTDNKYTVYLSTKTPLYNQNGDVIGTIGVSVDITDSKKKEQARKEKEVIEKISQTLEMLSGCIAHEIRTPLSSIKLNIGCLQEKIKKLFKDFSAKAEQKNEINGFIEDIKLAVEKGSSIVDMLLVKLRTVVNKNYKADPQKFKPVSIKACINDVIKQYPFYDGERELIVWDDEANEDFNYLGDDLQTSHVLYNLIKNAIKIIKEEERGKIYPSLKRGEKFNYLIFKDTAMGIPNEIFKTLFAQFNSGTRGGTGLGLAFCKMVMQSYGGDITCDSKYGEYTEFTLSFPVQQK